MKTISNNLDSCRTASSSSRYDTRRARAGDERNHHRRDARHPIDGDRREAAHDVIFDILARSSSSVRRHHEVRHLLRAPAPAILAPRTRSTASSRRRSTRSSSRTGSASTRLGGRAPLPRGVLATRPPRGVPRRAPASAPSSIRLGHGIVLALPGYNHPARIAERIATLDLVSRRPRGVRHRRDVVRHRARQASSIERRGQARACGGGRRRDRETMMLDTPYLGHAGKHFSMPARNVCRSHCSVRIRRCGWRALGGDDPHAAELGIGALTFSFISPDEARAMDRRLLRPRSKRHRTLSATTSTRTSPSSPASCATRTSRRPSTAGLTAATSSPTRCRTTTCSDRTRPASPTSTRSSRRSVRSMASPSSRPRAEAARGHGDERGGPRLTSGAIGTPDQIRVPSAPTKPPGRSGDLHQPGRQEQARGHL